MDNCMRGWVSASSTLYFVAGENNFIQEHWHCMYSLPQFESICGVVLLKEVSRHCADWDVEYQKEICQLIIHTLYWSQWNPTFTRKLSSGYLMWIGRGTFYLQNIYYKPNNLFDIFLYIPPGRQYTFSIYPSMDGPICSTRDFPTDQFFKIVMNCFNRLIQIL